MAHTRKVNPGFQKVQSGRWHPRAATRAARASSRAAASAAASASGSWRTRSACACTARGERRRGRSGGRDTAGRLTCGLPTCQAHARVLRPGAERLLPRAGVRGHLAQGGRRRAQEGGRRRGSARARREGRGVLTGWQVLREGDFEKRHIEEGCPTFGAWLCRRVGCVGADAALVLRSAIRGAAAGRVHLRHLVRPPRRSDAGALLTRRLTRWLSRGAGGRRDMIDGKHVGGTDDPFEFQLGRGASHGAGSAVRCGSRAGKLTRRCCRGPQRR